jgi:mannitol 2-dehydrogenase
LTSLTEETLTQLNADVSVPRYDRRRVTTGIVHIGVGGFHRSHQAMYIDTLMNNGAAMDWGICGIGLQPSNARMRDVLAAQDGLYTLVLRHGDGTWDVRVIGSIVEYLFAPDDPEAAIEKMAAPTTRIVSLTVTEGGYNLDTVTGELADDSRFTEVYSSILSSLLERGVRKTFADLDHYATPREESP